MDLDTNRVGNLHNAFDKEREAMEEMLVSVKSQVTNTLCLSLYLPSFMVHVMSHKAIYMMPNQPVYYNTIAIIH